MPPTKGTIPFPGLGKKEGQISFFLFVCFFLSFLFSPIELKRERNPHPHLIFCSEKVVNMYCLRADKRAKEHKWKRLPVCRKWEQRGNPPRVCVSKRSRVCGINRWRLSARRPIAAVPARILWEGAVPSETTPASCHGGLQEELDELKNIQQTSLGCARREIQCVREYLRLGLRAVSALIACYIWDKRC